VRSSSSLSSYCQAFAGIDNRVTTHLFISSPMCPKMQVKPILQLCFDLGVDDVRLLTGAEINSKSNYLVLLNGLIVG